MIEIDSIRQQPQPTNKQLLAPPGENADNTLYLGECERRIFDLVDSIDQIVALRSKLDGLLSWRFVKIIDRYVSTRTHESD